MFAERVEEKQDDVTTRFVMLFGGVVSTITKRICSDECEDEDAREVRKKLLNFMTREELDMLASQPALQTIEDYTQGEAQRMTLFAQEKRQDPLFDQYKLQRRATAAAFSPEFADDVLLPQNDPTEMAEQTREQLFENAELKKGTPIPVSPRDNHQIHIATLKPDFAPIAAQAAKLDPQALQIALIFVKHWEEHVDALQAGGYDKKALAPEVAEIKKVGAQLGKIAAQIQHAQSQMKAGASPIQAHASALGVTPDNDPGEPAPPPPPGPGQLGAAPPPAAQ